MTEQTLLELKSFAGWLAVAALCWYLLRIGIGVPLALLGSRSSNGALRDWGLRMVPRALRPTVTRWAAVPALSLLVASGPGIAAAQECAIVSLPVLDRTASCTAGPETGSQADHVELPARAASPGEGQEGASVPPVEAPSGTAPPSITVREGDTLWSLTAAALDSPTDAEIATAWPDLYHANKTLIGPDPGLIHPGTELRIPTGWEEEAR